MKAQTIAGIVVGFLICVGFVIIDVEIMHGRRQAACEQICAPYVAQYGRAKDLTCVCANGKTYHHGWHPATKKECK